MHPSRHALDQARHRQIPDTAIEAALRFGRRRSVRGAEVYTLGWREVRQFERSYPELGHWEGTEVVCSHDGTILTVYRNKNPRALRDRDFRRAA